MKIGQIWEHDVKMTSISLNYSKKLLLLVLSVGLIPIVLLSAVLYITEIETATDSLQHKLTSVSETGSKNISDWVGERKSNLFAIAQDNTIITSVKTLSDSKTEKDMYFESRFALEVTLDNYLKNFPNFQNFIISNTETGEIIFYTDLVRYDGELKNQNHFQQAVKGNIGMSEVFLSSKTILNEFGYYEKNIPTFFISSPIKGEEGIEGILTARVNAFEINSLVEQKNSFHTGDSYLVNSEGYFLSKPRLLDVAINSGLMEKRPELELQMINPNSNQFTEIFQSSDGKNTVYDLNGYINYLGNYVIGSISPVKGTDWSYVAEIEKNEAFSGIAFIQILILSVIAIVSLFMIIASFYFASGLTTPIKKLQNTAEQISKGNLDVEVIINSKDEIGDLSYALNFMTKNLKRAMTDIETQLLLQTNLRKALDESSIVAITDNEGRIKFANDKFCEISKYSKGELLGKTHQILKSNYHPSEFYEDLWKVISSGKVWHGDICNKAKDGSVYWVDTTIVPFLDADGKISEYVAVRNDITVQKELSQKLINSERLSAIGKLSARLAHDLRNPLSVIQVSLENLKMMYGTDEAKTKQFDKVERSIDRIVHQVDNVLDFVRGQPLQMNKTMASKVISESLDSLVIPNGVKINIPERDAELICDARQLSVVLNNLILNAIQALNGVGTIDIVIEEKSAHVIIEVKDSGPPIPEDVFDKIFDPLFTTKQQGTGLGLASVENIIIAHNGTISVKNDPTTFTITLPKIHD